MRLGKRGGGTVGLGVHQSSPPLCHTRDLQGHKQSSCAPCAQGWPVREVQTGGNKKKLSSSKDSPSHGGGEQHRGMAAQRHLQQRRGRASPLSSE